MREGFVRVQLSVQCPCCGSIETDWFGAFGEHECRACSCLYSIDFQQMKTTLLKVAPEELGE